MSASKKLRDQLDSLRRALPAARVELTATLNELESIKLRLDHLRSAPLARGDAVVLMGKAIGDAQERARQHPVMADAWRWLLNAPGLALAGDDASDLSPLRAGHKPDEAGLALLLLMIDPMKAASALLPALSEDPAKPAGPPISERVKEIATLSARQAELEEQRQGIEAVLVAAGEDLDRYRPKPGKPGPKDGDTLEPFRDHRGIMVRPTWRVLPMPGDEHGATTSGWTYPAIDADPGDDPRFARGKSRK